MNIQAVALPLTAAYPNEGRTVSQSDSMNEESLLYIRFLDGDDSAFILLFQRHNARLIGYCYELLRSREQAEDIVQEVWERFIELRNAPREISNPGGFITRIARNLSLDHLRSRKRLSPLDDLHESRHPTSSMEEKSVIEEIVLEALEKLTFDYREVLVLNLFCGYRFEEIAELLGKSPESIWTRASRARAQLRKLVAAAMNDEHDMLERIMITTSGRYR